jgi:transposase
VFQRGLGGPDGDVSSGVQSTEWKSTFDRHDKEVIHVEFARQTCVACAVRAQCTRSKTAGREVTLRPCDQHVALQAARQRQTTPEFKAAYAARSGIEGTLSQGIRVCALRQARYRGLAKTRLQEAIIATTINLLRVIAWLMEVPRESTRQSAFARLAPPAFRSATRAGDEVRQQLPLAAGLPQSMKIAILFSRHRQY